MTHFNTLHVSLPTDKQKRLYGLTEPFMKVSVVCPPNQSMERCSPLRAKKTPIYFSYRQIPETEGAEPGFR